MSARALPLFASCFALIACSENTSSSTTAGANGGAGGGTTTSGGGGTGGVSTSTSTSTGGTGGTAGSGGSGGGGGWSLSFGGDEHDYGALGTDAAGNVLFAGGFEGTDNIGGNTLTSDGLYDVFVAKLDSDGKHLWSKRYGDSDQQLAHAVKSGANGSVIVTGQFFSSIDFGGGPLIPTAMLSPGFLAALDANGAHLWSKSFGPIWSVEDLELAIGPQGSITIGAITNDPSDFGGGTIPSSGKDDLVLARYDAAGTHLWSKGFPNGTKQRRGSLAVDSMGDLVVAGANSGVIDFGGGGVAGAQGSMYLAKLDPSGAHLWSKATGGTGAQLFFVTDLAVGPDDSIHVAGAFYTGTVDFGDGPLTPVSSGTFIAKFDASGAHLWSRGFEVNGGVSSLAVDAGGVLIAAGAYEGTIDLGGGPLPATAVNRKRNFVARFDATGAHVSSVSIGNPTPTPDMGFASVGLGGGGEVYLQGTFWNTLDVGNGTLSSNGFTDVFLARLDIGP